MTRRVTVFLLVAFGIGVSLACLSAGAEQQSTRLVVEERQAKVLPEVGIRALVVSPDQQRTGLQP